MVLLVAGDRDAAAGRGGSTVGWVLQALVLATSLVVGWSMLVVGGIFVVLWWLAIHNGSRVDAMRAQARFRGLVVSRLIPSASWP